MDNKLMPMAILNKLEEQYELVDIIAALSICIMSTGMGIMAAMSYLRGKEKN